MNHWPDWVYVALVLGLCGGGITVMLTFKAGREAAVEEPEESDE